MRTPMTHACLSISAALLLSLAQGGCSNGGYDSGVDDTQPFDAISDTEARTACESLARYIEANISDASQLELTCTVQALGATTTPEACRESVQTCLGGTPEPFLGDLQCAGVMATTDCSATVGEVEQCITAELSQAFDRLDRISCDIAGDLDALQELMMTAPPPAECTTLADECPGLGDGFLD